MAWGALPALTVATFVPLGLFYAALLLGSEGWAIAASVVYSYGASIWQCANRRRVSGMLMVTMAMATLKAATVVVSGRPFLYFLAPAVETIGFGLTFALTMRCTEPLVLRLARDLVPSEAESLGRQRELLLRLSLVWAFAYIGSGVTTTLLLLTVPLPVFVGAHTLTGWIWTGSAAISSFVMWRRAGRAAQQATTRLGFPLVAAVAA